MFLDNITYFGFSEPQKYMLTCGTGGSANPRLSCNQFPEEMSQIVDNELSKDTNGENKTGGQKVAETIALYQQSYILSVKNNNIINILNSAMEIILTFFIFYSSYLVFQIWLKTPGSQSGQTVNTEQQVQKSELVIIATSISFFMIITLLDMIQILVTLLYSLFQSIKSQIKYFAGLSGDQRKWMSAIIIQYNSQLVVSNVQMFVMLCIVCIYGIVFGSIQVNSKVFLLLPCTVNDLYIKLMDDGIHNKAILALVIGALSAMILEYIRQIELERRPKGKYLLEQGLGYTEATEGGILHDDEEDKISLVPVGTQNHISSDYILKTDSDEGSDEDQLIMRGSVESVIAKF